MIKLRDGLYIREDRIKTMQHKRVNAGEWEDKDIEEKPVYAWYAEIEGEDLEIYVTDECAYDFLGLAHELREEKK